MAINAYVRTVFINQLREAGWLMRGIGRRIMQRYDQLIELLLTAAKGCEGSTQATEFAFIYPGVLLFKARLVRASPPASPYHRDAIHDCRACLEDFDRGVQHAGH